ncbi:hypothetical protein HK097_002854 [Rhizophlyctis rosea]|uniref:Uncharacterized protein n=1 Tax=Rhizophlyctis rosea TaxID=64517 RepID=A0AAD5S3Y5_9FUNG|nr:hypothetical protein HK097_002854 [Rhizophlyctis rosea]
MRNRTSSGSGLPSTTPRIISETGRPISSSILSQIPSKSQTISITSLRAEPKAEIMLEAFPKSSSGLFRLEAGWEKEEFEDPRYNIWRKAMIETLQHQIDYPLLAPPELTAMVAEDFLGE